MTYIFTTRLKTFYVIDALFYLQTLLEANACIFSGNEPICYKFDVFPKPIGNALKCCEISSIFILVTSKKISPTFDCSKAQSFHGDFFYFTYPKFKDIGHCHDFQEIQRDHMSIPNTILNHGSNSTIIHILFLKFRVVYEQRI